MHSMHAASHVLSISRCLVTQVNSEATPLQVFWPVILLYMIAAFLQGGPAVSMGLLNNVRQFLFISVSQAAYRYGPHLTRYLLQTHVVSLLPNAHRAALFGSCTPIVDMPGSCQ